MARFTLIAALLVAAVANAAELDKRTPQDCIDAGSFVDNCALLTPGFLELPNTAQANCFCHDSNGAYAPSSFDNLASGCYNYLKTADPALAGPYGSTVVGACTKFANSGSVASHAASTAFANPSAALSSLSITLPTAFAVPTEGSSPSTTGGLSGDTTSVGDAGNAPTGSPTATVKVASSGVTFAVPDGPLALIMFVLSAVGLAM